MARILVVEDDPDMRELLIDILEKEEYDTAPATNGNEAIQAMNEDSFDLIITDIVMPEKDGLSTILETKRKNENTKIIAISGGDRSFTGSSYLHIAKNIGVDRTISKPFDYNEFIQIVKDMLHT